jgi:hypothetical protein
MKIDTNILNNDLFVDFSFDEYYEKLKNGIFFIQDLMMEKLDQCVT